MDIVWRGMSNKCFLKWKQFGWWLVQLTWHSQTDSLAPVCGEPVVFGQTTVVSTVGHVSTDNIIFTVWWGFDWAGCSPFILNVFISLDLTSQSDLLTTEYLRPVGLQGHCGAAGNCLWVSLGCQKVILLYNLYVTLFNPKSWALFTVLFEKQLCVHPLFQTIKSLF